MSGLIVFRQSDKIHLLTDAAVYDGPIITDFKRKTHVVPGLPVVFSVLGSTAAGEVMAGLVERFPATSVDSFVRHVPDLVPIVAGALADANPTHAHIYGWLSVTVAGISEATGKPTVWQYYHVTPEAKQVRVAAGEWVEDDDQPINCLTPLRELTFMSPEPDQAYLDDSGWTAPRSVNDLDPATDGVVLMNALRCTPFRLNGNGLSYFAIGGFVTQTTVSAAGVEQSVIHSWPNDRIGRPLQPDVLRFNRAARRAMEAQQQARRKHLRAV